MSAYQDKAAYLWQKGLIRYLIVNNAISRNVTSIAMWKAIPEFVRQAVAEPLNGVLVFR